MEGISNFRRRGINMSFLKSLLDAYNSSIEQGIVDKYDGNNTILLPLYHTSLKSSGEDIIRVELTKDSKIFNANFVLKDEVIIFPVTSDSVARSGKNPPSHPLVDKLSYLSNENAELHELFLNAFNPWYYSLEDSEVKDFLKIIKKFISNSNFLDEVLGNLLDGREYKRIGLKIEYEQGDKKEKKTLDLSKTFLTFVINDFIGYKNISVTNYVELHNNYIHFVEQQNMKKIKCNISGQEEQQATKHRGLMGNAKLISVSNNTETYKGRFQSGSDIVQIGYQSSEKVHLMLKYLLENKNSRKWLSGQQYLINWFDNDVTNTDEVDILGFNLLPYEEEISQSIVSSENKKIGNSFVIGKKKFFEDTGYYAAIVDKASNGRISLKYFRKLEASQLSKNLDVWQNKYSWERYDYNKNKMKIATPSFTQLLLSAYGIDRDGKLQLDNDSFKKDQYQKLVVNLIDGRSLPVNIFTAMNQNIRKRLNYSENWDQIQFVALAIFSEFEKGEELTPVLDKNNNNRSYLYGRLLAIFERIESATYQREDGPARITNAQKFWTNYTNKPGSTMQILIERNLPYLKNLSQSNYGLFVKFEKEKNEIISLLYKHYGHLDELNEPLEYHFIFGYYTEMNYLFTKNESEGK